MSAEFAGLLTERAFEAAHLGGPVFDCIDPDRAVEAVALGREAGALLISCRTAGSGESLSAAGFRHVETLVTLERLLSDPPETAAVKGPVRIGGEGDIPACRRIAATALRFDRFHADPRIEDNVADLLKSDWIENDLRGRADVVFVAEVNDRVAGFCAMLLRPEHAVIDLIAVDPGRQGSGLGRALVSAALERYRALVPVMQVGTQAANPSSLAFYRSLGFKEIKRAETWHWMP